jgi:5-methylcytosine-specific restriction endonuclease McrA
MCETFKKSIATLTVDELRQLCLLNKISGMSAAKKADLIQELCKDYTKNCESLKKLKVDELEEMCRLKKIKGFSGYKKDDLVDLITLFDMSIKDTKDVKDVKDTKEVKDTKDVVNEPGETKEKEKKKEKPKKEVVATVKEVAAAKEVVAAKEVAVAKEVVVASKEASILELDEQMQELKARLELVEQIKKAKQEQEEKEHLEQERLEQERLEQERLEKERLEKERLEKERLEQERLEQERLEKERLEKERLERERSSEQSAVVDETTGVKKERKKKEIIPKSVRSHVWNLYIGPTINEHRCLCCKKAVIKITEFDCGHVIAESAGGTHEIGNLRPICSACNHAMGSQNMIEFVVKYGYYIG